MDKEKKKILYIIFQKYLLKIFLLAFISQASQICKQKKYNFVIMLKITLGFILPASRIQNIIN